MPSSKLPDVRVRANHESPHAPLRVLLVEDDPGYARLVQEYLREAKLSTGPLRTVTTLAQAIDVLEREPPDVVIADLGLPDANGDEVVPALRDAAPRIPIVILSGQDDIDKALESMQHGAQEFLVKGRCEDFFLARSIRAAIERKRFEEFEQLLIGVVSHDLRGPLQTFFGVIELLEHDNGPSDLTTVARNTLSQALGLVNDLLDFTQLRTHGLLPINKQSADLTACVTSIVDGLRLAHPGRTITVTADDDTTGWFDSARMSQAVSNLLVNALQHSAPESAVFIRCDATADELTVEVANRGEPIGEDRLATLFHPFERLHSKDGQRGSIGLGLYITQQIVHAHGGALTVTSTHEEGTRFRVSLPRSSDSAGADAG